MKILVVEDNTILRRNISRSLKLAGHIVHGAASGGAARHVLAREDIGMICLDLDLPDCHGLDLFEEVQALRPETQFIVITGTGGDDDRRRARDLGAKGFLSKPFALSKIHSLLADVH